MTTKYNHRKIEKKWQEKWEKDAPYTAKDFDKKPKKYILVEFPYPSGDGLHVGHTRSYCALDVIARKKRMEGENVLYPIGWDAFGLPTENYAIKKGIHPSIATKKNIERYKTQLKSLGLSFDWSREINTTDPEYYKWTQWIFLKFFEKGLAYQAEMPINWCSNCKIGLANEEVVGGNCERCGNPAERKNQKQWMLKITEYADRLLEDLKSVDYLDKIRIQQENWIGKSEGVLVKFLISNFQFPKEKSTIKVFTTRIDTLFGVTALVLAPEHELVETLTTKVQQKKVAEYIKASKRKSEVERTVDVKEKTGVFTGSYCVNPVNDEEIPVWVGDYVIASYGGGAVMVVPAHDKRDYAFAKKYSIEIREVVSGGDISKEAYIAYGKLINSGEFDGLFSKEAIDKITGWLTGKNLGEKVIQYKLRDWIFSRQHYWGEPIPIVHCEVCGVVPVPEKELPVELPYVKKYEPTNTGESPLASIKEWVNVECPKCKLPAKRETDTMPNWAGSSWYFLRYADPHNKKEFADLKKLKYWTPVDLYNGGMEHTTLHLLYSRFWHKFLYDLKLVPTSEPYLARRSHGMVLAEDKKKMSKSFGNVINPDDVIKKFGSDSVRIYEMFMGPFDQAINWSTQGLVGANRFLNKVWNLKEKISDKVEENKDLERVLHQTIKKVTEDIESLHFNTAISQLMIFVNKLEKQTELPVTSYRLLITILAPFTPHISEELWEKLGNEKSVFAEKWPMFNLKKIEKDLVEIVVQIDGKFRGSIKVNKDTSQKDVEKVVGENEKFNEYLSGKKPNRIVFLKNKLINLLSG